MLTPEERESRKQAHEAAVELLDLKIVKLNNRGEALLEEGAELRVDDDGQYTGDEIELRNIFVEIRKCRAEIDLLEFCINEHTANQIQYRKTLELELSMRGCSI